MSNLDENELLQNEINNLIHINIQFGNGDSYY